MCAAARVESIHSTTNFGGQFHPAYHATDNRRTHERLPLSARVRLKRVAGKPLAQIDEYEGMDISCSGLRFRSVKNFLSGTDLDLEVILLDRQQDGSSVRMFTSATVVRSAPLGDGAENSVAVAFTDIAISRSSAIR